MLQEKSMGHGGMQELCYCVLSTDCTVQTQTFKELGEISLALGACLLSSLEERKIFTNLAREALELS